MVGLVPVISQGLELFNRRCHNSILEIDLEFKEKFPANFIYTRLEGAIGASDQALKFFSVRHFGEFAARLQSIAGKCPSLQVLRSIELEGAVPQLPATQHSFTGAWSSRLQVLEWRARSGKLVSNPSLIEVLKEVKVVEMEMDGDDHGFTIQILSSCSTLEKLHLSEFHLNEEEEIPIMDQPILPSLSLSYTPVDEDYSGKTFGENLQAPSLKSLSLISFDPVALRSFKFGSNLSEFTCKKLDEGTVEEVGVDNQVATILKTFRSWQKLEILRLEISDSFISLFQQKVLDSAHLRFNSSQQREVGIPLRCRHFTQLISSKTRIGHTF